MPEPTPVIIEAAINGATPKSRNPHSPRTPDEIAEAALLAMEAGAAIVHNHNDDPVLGGSGYHDSAPYARAWEQVVAARPDAHLYPTMAGGGPHITIEERYRHVVELNEMGLCHVAPLDPGSLNLGGIGPDGVPGATDSVYLNPGRDIAAMMATCESRGLAPAMAWFEAGFGRTALAYQRAGRLPAGSWAKFFLTGPNLLFGLPGTMASLDACISMLGDSPIPWAVAVIGGDVTGLGLARAALERGGHVRVGLEDYAGPRTPTNVELIREIVAIAEACGRPIATPTEAATLLNFPQR